MVVPGCGQTVKLRYIEDGEWLTSTIDGAVFYWRVVYAGGSCFRPLAFSPRRGSDLDTRWLWCVRVCFRYSCCSGGGLVNVADMVCRPFIVVPRFWLLQRCFSSATVPAVGGLVGCLSS